MMNHFFTSISLIITLIFLGDTLFAGNIITVLPVRNNQTILSIKVKDYSLKNVTINGIVHQAIVADNTVPNLNAGMPGVPGMSARIMIPDSGNSELTVLSTSYTDYPNVNLVPSKGTLMRNINPSSVPYTKGAQYKVDAFYPSNIASLRTPFIMRDIRGQVVVVQPFQYNPVTKVLRVYDEIQVGIKNIGGEGINEIKENISSKISEQYLNIYKDQFINYSQENRYTQIDEVGSMLIICGDTYVSSMEDFVNWKIAKGIPTEIVSINSVGNSQNEIADYIADYYNNNNNTFVLLVGDHADVNCFDMGISGSGETLWSDTRYGYISGSDSYPEVLIGRFSASSVADLATQINRTLEYEKTPAQGDWYKKAVGIGSAEGAGFGDNGEADWEHLRNIRTDLMSFGFTEVYELYDGSQGGEDADGNPNSSMVSEVMNDGVTVFNYTGHGGQNGMSTGSYSSGDINNETNYGKYPMVTSVACNNGTFATGTCLAETFLRARDGNNPKGAISCSASSILMAWSPPMATQDEIVDILVESYANNRKYTLGGLFYNGQSFMLDQYNNTQLMDTWVFFGDPSITIRTADPIAMTATHLESVLLGTSSLVVECNVDDALICVSQNNQIIGTGLISGGTTTISLTGLSNADPLTVVGTKYNYKPYEGTVTVTECMPSTSTINEIACDIYTAPDGNIYTSTGTYTAVILNASGCDSTITIDLTVGTLTLGTDIQVACDAYTWIDGMTYTSSTNTPTYILANTLGCDSMVILNLTINSTNTGFETVTACDSYTWPTDGITYGISGTYTRTLTNAIGCDSIVTLYLTVINSNTGSETATACDSYTWAANGNTYSASGAYSTTLTNANGCDSVITLNLTVINSNTGSETATACDSYTWAADGNTYNTSGAYTTTLTNANGCDSTVTLNLTVTNSNTVSETATACDSYTWATDGNTYNTSGAYTATLTNVNGCDSIVTLNLIINNVSDLTTSVNGITINANNSSATYEWLDCDNNYSIITGETNQLFTPLTNGNYAIQLTENGCIDTTECIAITSVGIIENDFGNDLTVYPNPTEGKFLIDLGENYKAVAITMTDLNGKVLHSKRYTNSQLLNLKLEEPSGIYLMMIESADKMAIIRLIKE